jgi:carboxymethylenebutenolidase
MAHNRKTFSREAAPMSRTATDIKTADGVCPTSVFLPDGRGPWPAVILYMDGPGIRPVLFDMAQRIASAGYVVLLPDLFYRAGPYDPVDPKLLFGDPERRAAHGKFFTSTSNRKAAADTRALLDYLDTRNDVAGPRVGVTGYCMGGGIALTAAATYPDRIAAAASFHGGRLATDADDSPHKLAGQIRARVLVIGADNDQGFPVEQAERLRRALAEAGVDHRVEIWPGVAHGWTMPDIPIYDAAAAERHFEELLALFGATLEPQT